MERREQANRRGLRAAASTDNVYRGLTLGRAGIWNVRPHAGANPHLGRSRRVHGVPAASSSGPDRYSTDCRRSR
jgi:hypothetical protein